MTLITTDSQHYADIASAIRSKAGVQDLFKPSQMAPAIAAIPTGGGVLGSKTIDANGTYYASADSLDGYSQVTVSVSGGGGDDSLLADVIERGSSLTSINFNGASRIGEYAFYFDVYLATVTMDNVLDISASAFAFCSSLATAVFPSCQSVRESAFYYCKELASVSMPNCTSIWSYAFNSCAKLSQVDFPLCTSIGNSAFVSCVLLESAFFSECINVGANAFSNCGVLNDVRIPKCEFIGQSAFRSCKALSELLFPNCKSIGANAFYGCVNLISLNLVGVSSIPNLVNSNAFLSTPIGGYSTSAGQYGSVYVPSSLYNDFLVASNWSYFSDRMVSV